MGCLKCGGDWGQNYEYCAPNQSEEKIEYPLYPELSNGAKIEAEALIADFKKKLSKAADEAIGKLYCNIVPFIESDSWSNFRNQIMDGFKNYDNRKIQGEYDFSEIRKQIFIQFREEIISELNQDLVDENNKLKNRIEELLKCKF
ncbi:MAG TPA: hypothetical protein VJ327_11090 [Patescibacteria group bacterium]|nr:hypothetical protein [Patescibacteria group bacterium]